MLTIEKIEGNSRLGVPVFSYAGRQSNYQILIFQPTYEQKKEILERNNPDTTYQQQVKTYKNMASYLTAE